MESRDIKSVAIPALGCGLGGLNWAEVREIITRELQALRDVRVVVFEPNARAAAPKGKAAALSGRSGT
jgi:O-acetyl-ADP-ribose deacetylase (regulator of RNase III)